MRRLPVVLTMELMMLASALPALAQEEDPLINSTLLPNAVGWALTGLAVLLMILFILWTRRNPS
jgi:hypothetical protein